MDCFWRTAKLLYRDDRKGEKTTVYFVISDRFFKNFLHAPCRVNKQKIQFDNNFLQKYVETFCKYEILILNKWFIDFLPAISNTSTSMPVFRLHLDSSVNYGEEKFQCLNCKGLVSAQREKLEPCKVIRKLLLPILTGW